MSTYSKHFQKTITDINWFKVGDNFIHKSGTLIFTTIVFAIILWVGKWIINSIFKQTRRIEILGGFKRAETFRTITLNLFRYITYFCYLYAILSIVGVPVGTLIAGAGIFSIALGLGAQGFVSDVVNGFFILLEEQLDVGDLVEINNIKGTVTALGLRTTRLLSPDGTVNFIPNRSISIIKNFSRHSHLVNIDLNIPTNANFEKVKVIITKENQQIMQTEQAELVATPEIIGPVDVNGKLVFRVAVNMPTNQQAKLTSQLLSVYLKALARGGIHLTE
ncbi:mechanosensitive ion channel family protein [Limosilactobacillus caecicola]|uniref:mechanosensitive ion channel family protein n=1 Tax=Limosilactobacillus caecicola TaxID=2941332 RepID=UPI0020404C52|nr:mechanosensitive ion channel domain-containing protein [Limosilactobacillus caecicola]